MLALARRIQRAKAMKRRLAPLLLVMVVVEAGCAWQDWIDRTLITENVTGFWSGTVGPAIASVQLDLRQEGAKVTGTVRFLPGPVADPLEGGVAGDVFTFKGRRGGVSAELTVGGDENSGQMFGSFGKRPISLRRADPASVTDPPTR